MLNHDNELLKYIEKFTLSNNFSYINKIIISILHKYPISREKLFGNETIKIRDTVAPNCKLSIINELILIKD